MFTGVRAFEPMAICFIMFPLLLREAVFLEGTLFWGWFEEESHSSRGPPF